MIRVPKILMVGATARNLGKTGLVCAFLKKFCPANKIIGLKILTHYQGDSHYHGSKQLSPADKYIITEETNKTGIKGTSRMLQAGAYKAYLIRSWNNFLKEAIDQFYSQYILNNNNLIICESNSLRKVVEPDIFLMIKDKHGPDVKRSAVEVEKYVDKFVIFNGDSFDLDFDQIEISEKGWILKK
ncbi:MAG: hypothetical protein ABII90_09105 [Bacteroidota bacterium]